MQFESYIKQLFISITVHIYFHKNVFYIDPKFHIQLIPFTKKLCFKPKMVMLVSMTVELVSFKL